MSIKELFSGITPIEKKSANIALFLLRFYAGFTIMNAGLDKLPLKDWMVEQVVGLGFPVPTLFAWIATFSEFAFGFLLIVGAWTRISGLMLAITLGVAAFGFHKVLPLVDMHITQYFFWIFILFTFLGAGKYSIDYLLTNSDRSKYIPTVIFSLLLFYGIFIEFSRSKPQPEGKVELASINIAGSFNEWNPTTSELENKEENKYSIDIDIEQAGLMEFKLIANKTWDTNFGEENQSADGFPIFGKAELDKGNSTSNIKAYIPRKGNYRIVFDSQTLEYSLDSIKVN